MQRRRGRVVAPNRLRFVAVDGEFPVTVHKCSPEHIPHVFHVQLNNHRPAGLTGRKWVVVCCWYFRILWHVSPMATSETTLAQGPDFRNLPLAIERIAKVPQPSSFPLSRESTGADWELSAASRVIDSRFRGNDATFAILSAIRPLSASIYRPSVVSRCILTGQAAQFSGPRRGCSSSPVSP